MSYDPTNRLFARRAVADFRAANVAAEVNPRRPGPAVSQPQLLAVDAQRVEFIARLVKSGVQLTEWETEFAASLTRRSAALRESQAPCVLSERERAKCDQMRECYALQLAPPAPYARPAAEPGGCEFLIRGEDGRRLPCNVKATWKTFRGLRLCDAHHAAAGEQRKRGLS